MAQQIKVELSAAEPLINNIKTIVRLRQEEPLRLMNFVTIKLFWEIGFLLNVRFKADDNTNLHQLSKKLVENYGPFFSLDNLETMRVFSSNCQENTLKKIAPYILWRFVPSMVTLSSQEEWIFYARLIIQEHLEPKTLKKQIVSKRFEKTQKSGVQSPDFPFHDLKVTNNKFITLPVNNFFKEPFLNDFRPFFEIKDGRSLAPPPYRPQIVEELYINIEKKIQDIQDQFNSHFNLRFNLSLWEIGSEINRFSIENNVENIEEFVQVAFTNLNSANSTLFNSESLFNYHLFAEQFERQTNILILSELLKWEHILLLLRITNMNEILFYALATIEKNLSSKDLQKLIVQDTYNKSSTNTFNLKASLKIKSLPSVVMDNESLLKEFDMIANDLINKDNRPNNIFLNNYFLEFVQSF